MSVIENQFNFVDLHNDDECASPIRRRSSSARSPMWITPPKVCGVDNCAVVALHSCEPQNHLAFTNLRAKGDARTEKEVLYQCGVCIDAVVLQLPQVHIFARTLEISGYSGHKSTFIRWTCDDWKSCQDAEAKAILSASDGVSGQYMTTLRIPSESQSISFAICYTTNNEQFWDNNNSQNYTIRFNSRVTSL